MDQNERVTERKIDYIMGLDLDYKTRARLQQGVFRGEASINQMMTPYSCFTPTFLNVEIKKQLSPVDPLVQLGVWISAEYRKRADKGYDRSMPVLAISVTGVEWVLYMAYDAQWKSDTVEEVVCAPYSRLIPVHLGCCSFFEHG